MERREILNKLNAVAEPSKTWLEDAQNRIENRKTLEYSQKIALRILRELRKQNKSQTDLAKALGVSKQQVNKWMKGSENFTIDTIAKIDAVLDLRLLNVDQIDEHDIVTTWQIETDVKASEVSKKDSKNYKSSTPIISINIKPDDYQTPSPSNLAS